MTQAYKFCCFADAMKFKIVSIWFQIKLQKLKLSIIGGDDCIGNIINLTLCIT